MLLRIGLLAFVSLILPMTDGFAAGQQVSDLGSGGEWFSYSRQSLPPPSFSNSPRVRMMVRDGRVELSVRDLVAAAIENNLDLAGSRFNSSVAATDILRARSGQAPRGVQGAPVPSGLFAGALGAGLAQIGAGGGAPATGAAVTGQGKSVFVPPQGSYDPALFLNVGCDRATVPLNTLRIAGLPVVTTPTAFVQGAYQQAFTSGTTISMSVSNQRQSSNQEFLIFNPALSGSFAFAATQQLWNGFGFGVNRRFLDVARNNKESAREFFLQSAVTTIAQVQNSYWDLVGARENVRIADQGLAIARQLYQDDQERLKVGVLSSQDLVTDESEIASRERDLISAQADLESKEIALKSLFTKRVDPELGSARLQPVDPLPEPRQSDIPALADALSAAMRNRPELRQAELALQNQDVVVRFTRNNLKPTLTAFGVVAGSSLAGTRVLAVPGFPPVVIPGGLAQSLRQLGTFRFPEYAVGITLVIPIRNRSAQADNLRARLEERQQETSLQQLRTRIRLEVTQAFIGLVQNRAQVEASRAATHLRSKLLDGEEEKLKVGQSSPYQIIQLQRDLEAARLAETQALVSYAKALVEMARSTGTTLEKAGITSEEAVEGRVVP